MTSDHIEVQDLRSKCGFSEEETLPWFDENHPSLSTALNEDEFQLDEEENDEVEAHDEDQRTAPVNTSGHHPFDDFGHTFGIRQMASVLLSDTSESEEDGEESHQIGAHVDKNQITQEMYKAIKSQIIDQKAKKSTDPFMIDWIEQQERMYFAWKEKHKMKKAADTATEEGPMKPSDDTDIPKVTILNPKPKFTRKQIEERMAKMDPVKRERWENWFIQCELGKNVKQPVMTSNVRKDFKRITESDGPERLKQHYRTELGNLKENIRISVEKMETILNQLEGKEPKPKSDRQFEEEVEQDHSGPGSDSSDSSDAEDDTPLTEQEAYEFEEEMCKKILIPPNEQKIQELLNIKLIYPEKPPEPVKLGRSKAEVEKSFLESKGLESYIMRILYFFQYKSKHDANFVRSEYEEIVKNILAPKGQETGTNKGCLLIYENVYMAIVMVEGTEFEILKHLSKFQRTDLFASIKVGKVLYIHQLLVKTYFNKWVVRVESPPAGKITYLTKSKKVTYRTAASRVARVSEMLHKLYRHISKEEKYLVDPRSIYTKSKYIILLPSPALFAYLFKYRILRDLKTYLEDLGKPLYIESDDEQLFAFTEDAIYSNYIDSDHDEGMKKAKLNYAKAVVQEDGAEHRRKIKDMNDLRLRDTGATVSWDDFCLDEISSSVVDGRIKMADNPNHPAVRLGAAIEARQNNLTEGIEKSKPHMKSASAKSEEILTFLEKGSEGWVRKIEKHGLNSGKKLSYLEGKAENMGQEQHPEQPPEISVTRASERNPSEIETESDFTDSDVDDSYERESDSSSSESGS